MYHLCLAHVFQPLKAGMTTLEIVKCPDSHFRRAVYGLGPYIADYPEQVWLAAIVQVSQVSFIFTLRGLIFRNTQINLIDAMHLPTISINQTHTGGLMKRLTFSSVLGIREHFGVILEFVWTLL